MMGKLKKKDQNAVALTRKRWAGIPPEKRSEMMSMAAKKGGGRPRIYPPCEYYTSKRHKFSKVGVCKCGFSKAVTS